MIGLITYTIRDRVVRFASYELVAARKLDLTRIAMGLRADATLIRSVTAPRDLEGEILGYLSQRMGLS